MGLTRSEQETVIRWDEDEKVVHVYAASPVTWRKMARLGFTPDRETKLRGEVTGRFYSLPVTAFRWGLKRQGRPGVQPPGLTRRSPRDSRGLPSPDAAPEAS